MLYLKQSTASQSVLIGPFIDDVDGKTAETGLTIANTDLRLSKNGGNMAQKNSGGGTHDEAGFYAITLDATDTDTVGRLQVSADVSGALPVWAEFQVVEEDVYEFFYASGATPDADVAAILVDTTSLNDTKIPDTISLAAINAECDTALVDYDAVIPADLNDPTAAVVAAAVWDLDATSHQTGGTFGQAIGDPGANTETIYDAVVTDAAGTNVAADVVAVKAETALIVADTAELQTDDVPGLIAALNDLSSADILNTALTESYAANGVAPTLTQVVLAIQQMLMQFGISGTSYTVRKLDNTATAFVVTLDDATNPTDAKRV